jgi:PKD repeat protein
MKTTDEYTFVVYNKNGRMDVIDGTVRNVVYSNSGYKIALKMDGIEYTSSYRSEVLWDFGDGTTKKGKVVEHNYSKPGHYTISATLFDENKESCKVSNTVNVIVKELLPTVIKFDDSNTEIKCSKIEKIARLECMVSNLTDAPLEVKVKRIYQKLNLGQEGEESRGKSYFDVKNKLNFHIDKYWTTLKNTKELYHNCD